MLSVDYVLVGQKIKEKRLQKSLTREQLAELCDISPSYIAHIERGTKSLSLETAVKICSVLNVSLDYLLLDEIQNNDRIFNAIQTEINSLSQSQKEKFIKFARLILKNIDEL
ncbi:MAG: helix-turn-helix transcriptional regulator [Ruminococcus sp.]|nr:helix-turn-helix transcriptional regulator [Ruminococcus sp.]MBR6393571.1 helix-turn-helix transcriptional regulator [Ruminococcus sp.]